MTARLRRFLGIRLGVLDQHPPRPLDVPDCAAPSKLEPDLPVISLVTPSFNQGQYIGETVRSVLGQHYSKLEYVIQDACSSDNTGQVLAQFPVDAFFLVRERDTGQADAINRGFARSQGEIMGWLNSDDFLMPGSLCKIGAYFRDNPEVDVVYGDRVVVNEHGLKIGMWALPGHDVEVLRQVDYIPQETMYWRRRLWDRAGGQVDASLKFAMDWELLLRFSAAGAKFAHLPVVLGAFRVHSAQKTSAQMSSVGFDEIRRLRQQYGGGCFTRLRRRVRHMQFLARHWVNNY
ncbi:glycosyltransferase family 2 protein [Pseudomonas sp.]|uniref:glycosyltransferase family 2 protein n=1 Tax=Pseudomonas sp. TaxID=306 RepID=UPI00260A1557|nr:glycosyltransferase family 2 protein [Pseudomonas sp.]